MPSTRPRIESMDETACRELLRRARIGRLAFSFQDRVDIQPLSFVLDGDWLFGRTGSGEKLATIRHQRWVAFQVDEVENPWNWESAVVRGPFLLLAEDHSEAGRAVLHRARGAIRARDPEAFSEQDPTPQRRVVFGIAIQELTGRRSIPD